ncbi:acireductone synthase [bacterium]|nr:acireductone synthase [bacterium]
MTRALLLDIEGTTTPISFVYEVLFPYARARMADFLAAHWHDTEVRGEVAGLTDWLITTPAEATRVALALMDEDRKLGSLKSLQGRIWKDGYRTGQLYGQLFDEVADRLKDWKDSGCSVNIYSSGSVLAQQLLFGHSQAGDLRPLIDGYFDTAVGAKTDPDSYRLIAQRLSLQPGQGLFATDIVGEASAAHEAGWQAVIVRRPGNHPQPPHSFPEWTEISAPANRPRAYAPPDSSRA